MKEIVALVLGSGAFFSFLQFWITRHDNKKGMEKQLKEVKDDVQDVKKDLKEEFREMIEATNAKIDRNQAVLCRTHILRFADEQRSGTVHHSKEYFEQQIQDIDTYEAYCRDNPEFRNGLTVMASEYIRNEYRRIYLSND